MKPSKEFLRELATLTDRNCHTESAIKIAVWCWESCTNEDDRAIFRMFENVFDEFSVFHNAVGNFRFGELRSKVESEMFSEISRVFGDETLNQIKAAL